MLIRTFKIASRLIFFLLFVVASAHAETWVKVVTPHFTVVSNGGEKEARRVALDFEKIRALIALLHPSLRMDGSAQTIVFAPKDVDTFDKLVPYYRKEDSTVAGLFKQGWERNYVIVRLDILEQAEPIVYHEYMHNVLSLNFTRIPTWLDEGLSEFYSQTRFQGDKIYIGAPNQNELSVLRHKTPLPLKTILTVDERSPYYHDEDKVQMFYSESWALTHYLEFGDGMDNGKRLRAYIALLQKKTSNLEAFQQTFGDLDQLDSGFRKYISKFLFTGMVISHPLQIDDTAFQSGPMSAAETDAEMGGFFNYLGSSETANKWLTAALAADTNSALAHENMAFYAFRKGDDDTARKQFDQALALAPHDYLAVYYQAMMRYGTRSDEDSLDALDTAMKRVLQLNPTFAPALVVRSQVLVKENQMQDAYNVASQAWHLEPDRAGYLTHLAAILDYAHDFPQAIADADEVVSRWTFTDGAEAIAVADHARKLGNVPETPEETAAETDEMKYAAGLLSANGFVASVTCEPSKPIEFVLSTPPKGEMRFEASGGFNTGLTDTLWYGEDHFNVCHHLEGMKAVIRYTKSTDPTPKNVIRWLEIRDGLIPMVPTPPATNVTPPPAQPSAQK